MLLPLFDEQLNFCFQAFNFNCVFPSGLLNLLEESLGRFAYEIILLTGMDITEA